MSPASLPFSYVVPVRWPEPCPFPDLPGYLRDLAQCAEVLLVDGSDPDVAAVHRMRFAPPVRYLPVDPELRASCRSGKVAGVVTGLRAASATRVVVADDDVRWDRPALDRAVALLDDADIVVPQNYFDPLPWHARWDTARTLLNRVTGGDHPGTLVLRREPVATVGYDGDVLFENLELRRTVAALGGREVVPLDLYVRRVPPSAAHFRGQRVRQAYDEFARPGRMALSLALLPGAAVLAMRAPRALAVVAAGAVGVAEVGRRRAGGQAVFPPTSALWAPLWVAERTVTSWLAAGTRLRRGGVVYGGTVVRRAASRPAALQARLAVERAQRFGADSQRYGRRTGAAGGSEDASTPATRTA